MAHQFALPLEVPVFSSADTIVEVVVARAIERDWPLSYPQLSALAASMPTDHLSKPESVLSVDIWLGDLEYTMVELVAWLEDIAPGSRGRCKSLNEKKLRLLNPDRYGNDPSVRWVEIDLTANRRKTAIRFLLDGDKPCDVRDPSLSAGPEVYAAFAVHPRYAPVMLHLDLPIVCVAGLQQLCACGGHWSSVPDIAWDHTHGHFDLRIRADDVGWGLTSMPTRRDL